jgi:hypothetical protein
VDGHEVGTEHAQEFVRLSDCVCVTLRLQDRVVAPIFPPSLGVVSERIDDVALCQPLLLIEVLIGESCGSGIPSIRMIVDTSMS